MKTALAITLSSLISMSAFAQQGGQALSNDAATLMQQKCFVCHSPTADQTNRLAPPMAAVKMHYISKYAERDTFVSAVSAFVKNPTEEQSLMYGAVKRFKVMPKQEFDEQEVAAIAAFIFENDLTEPEWFADHKKEMMGEGKGHGMKHQEGNGCQGCNSGQGQCKMHGSN